MNTKALNVRIAVISFLLMLGFSETRAQSYYFKQYNVNDGLPFVQVYAIHQDAKGYLWTGGYGGLSRFDGENFKNWGKQEGLVNTFVTAIASDPDNNLWIGTTRGLNILQGEQMRTLGQGDGLVGLKILSLKQNDTSVFVGCEGGLSVFHTSGTVDKLPLVYEDDPVNVLSLENKGQEAAWLGTNHGLYQYDRGKVTRINLPRVPDNIRVESLLQDEDSTLYIGTNRGLIVYRAGKTKRYSFAEGLIGMRVKSILRIDSSRLWIATDVGLHEFHSGKIDFMSIGNHPSSNNVEVLYRDYENNVWLGTYYGLFKSMGRVFQNYSFKDGFPAHFIFQITEAPNGNLLIATRNNGLFEYDRTNFTVYNSSHGLPSNLVRPILATEDEVFIGTSRGLSIRKQKQFRNYSKEQGLPFQQIYGLHQSQDGLIYLGGPGAYATFDGTSFQSYPVSDMKGVQVWAFHENDQGMWIGTYEGGLYLQTEDSLISMSEKWELENENFIGIAEDRYENLWFATFEGVLFYDKKADTLKRITAADGLNSNLLYCLTVDKPGKSLWMGTNQGVNQMDLEAFYKRGRIEIQSFGIEDGFVGVECNAHGAFCDSRGTIWFGTVNGLISMEPEAFTLNTSENRLLINGFKLFYEDTVLQENVKLPPDKNHLTIKYKGICLSNPEKVYYRFKLEGYDKKWSPVTKLREATYANLPPGRYTFKVISRNNSGLWNTEPEEFKFSVAFPIWMKWWFLGGSGTLAIAMIYLGITWRIRRINQRSELERRMENLKLHALRSQMNPHFIFNSMNSIQHFINNNEKREANLYLSKFARLMRIILDNSRKPAVFIMDDLQAVTLYMELEQMRFEERFNFEIKLDPAIEQEDPKIPPMLIQPFVENSIIHGFTRLSRKGHIEIAISQKGLYLVCHITDNGIGRSEAQKIKERKESKLHRSAGMSIIRERLDTLSEFYREELIIHVEDLNNDSGEPCGTRVMLKIPVTNAKTERL